MRDSSKIARRAALSPSAIRLREFHTGTTRLRSSASAAANQAGSCAQMGGAVQVRTGEDIPLLHASEF